MSNYVPFKLARVFLTMHLRDRQAILFSMFFPVAFMLALGLTGRGGGDPMELGIVQGTGGELAERFIEAFKEDPLFQVTEGVEQQLQGALIEGELQMVLVLPSRFEEGADANELRLLVDQAQTRQLALLLPAFEKALVRVERELRGTEPLFSLGIEDVKARSRATSTSWCQDCWPSRSCRSAFPVAASTSSSTAAREF